MPSCLCRALQARQMGEETVEGGGGGETTDGRGRWVGGGNGCVFRGCLAGDLLEEWIQK